MTTFNEEYPGKFSLGKITPGDKKPSRLRVWEHVLREFTDEIILHAAMHLVSTRPDWPPDLATMRAQCVSLVHGELQDETGSEAWEQVVKKINHEDVELSEMQKKALKQTGKTIYDLRQTTNLASDRSRYIEAFNNLISKRRMERITLPEVKRLVERNRPALPAPATKQLEEDNTTTRQTMSYAEAVEEFGPEMDNLKKMMGGE
jgi:hypothetical protein